MTQAFLISFFFIIRELTCHLGKDNRSGIPLSSPWFFNSELPFSQNCCHLKLKRSSILCCQPGIGCVCCGLQIHRLPKSNNVKVNAIGWGEYSTLLVDSKFMPISVSDFQFDYSELGRLEIPSSEVCFLRVKRIVTTDIQIDSPIVSC